MPFREAAAEPRRLYRSLPYGDLVELVVLDTRISGRTAQSVGLPEERRLLDDAQAAFLADRLTGSSARYKVICQQVMVANITGAFPNPDQWDGYPAERAWVLEMIRDMAIDGVVVLTGDIHSSWALDLAPDGDPYDPATGAGSVAVEIVAPGITSPGPGAPFERLVRAGVPHAHYVDLASRGYVVLDVDTARLEAAWMHLADVADWTAAGGVEHVAAVWSLADATRHLAENAEAAAPDPSPPPLAP